MPRTRPPPEGSISTAATDLLLTTARSVLTAEDTVRVRSTLAAIDDWTALIQAALDHGTSGLLCHHILTAGADLLPREIADAAEAYVAYRRTEHGRAARDLGAVLDAFAAAQVSGLPYKGPVLAALCYAEPALRGCRDLDVLIHERDIAAAMTALHELGYRSLLTGLSERRMRSFYAYNGQDALVADDRMPVEPHWRLNPRTMHADIDTSGLLCRAGTVGLDGRNIPAPSREDMLLICGMHGSKEEWSRLIWIADVAALLRNGDDLNWAEILAHADDAGVRRMLLIGIALAENMLGARLPAEAAHALAEDKVARRLAATAAARLFVRRGVTPSVYHITGFRLRMRERISDRARYVAATLLTARKQHFQFVDLPERLTFLYPLVRLGHDYVALPLWRLAHAWTPRAR
jgi:Uncharacterised nucleotidyltransferase